MIKPVGNRLLIRIEMKKGAIELIGETKKENQRFFIEAIGDEVGNLEFVQDASYGTSSYAPKQIRVTHFKVGQEIVLYNHTHFQGFIGCEETKEIHRSLISANDVWGIVE